MTVETTFRSRTIAYRPPPDPALLPQVLLEKCAKLDLELPAATALPSKVGHKLQNGQLSSLLGASPMHTKLLCIVLIAASCVACSADKHHTDPPSRSVAPRDINDITKVMLEFARTDTTPSSLVRAITGTPPTTDLSTEYRTYHHGAFESMDGYLITDLEVRVRSGGFDAASFILLHLSDDPCLSLEPFARSAGTVNEVFFPASPHATNGTSARGYALDVENGGELMISSRGDESRSCVTLITTSAN